MRDDPIKIRTGDLWSWKWGDWVSPAFPYLEERAWTPVAIGGRLCFVACDAADIDDPADRLAFDNARWCVVWGDTPGPWFDDVSNLGEHGGRPIYLARERHGDRHLHVVARDDSKSQAFDHQIDYETGTDGVTIRAFDPRRGPVGPAVPAVWRKL